MKRNLAVLSILLTVCIAASAQQSAQLSKDQIHETVKQLGTALVKNYVFPGKAENASMFLHSKIDGGFYDSILDPNLLANTLFNELQPVLNDKHFRIVYNPSLEKEILSYNSRPAQLVTDLQSEKKKNFYFRKIEILPGNVGYLEFNGFALPNKDFRKTLGSVMGYLANCEALIIDLRSNRGGNGKSSGEILSYFFQQKTNIGRSYNRISNEWTNSYVKGYKSNRKGIHLNMPVYLLTGRNTYSAGEGFAYALQQQRNSTVVGSPTAGGAHLTRSVSLGNGFVGFIPYQRTENAKTGTDWEGTGVIPNVSTMENALIIAHNLILLDKIAKATGKEKDVLLWIINYNKSTLSSGKSIETSINSFTGRFAEFEITGKDQQLFFRDVNQKNTTPAIMVPIDQDFYQVGKDYQVRFESLSNGQYQNIRVFWSDGYSEKIGRLHSSE